MRILHIVPSLNVETGGPARSVSALADAQAAVGLDVTVLTLDYQRHGRMLAPTQARLEALPAGWLARATRGWSLAFARRAGELASRHDLIHNHGLWMQVNRHARMAAVANHKPLVISPRGMLEPYSRDRSRWRKRLAYAAFEKANLTAASHLHATSDQEAQAIRQVLPDASIIVLPNIVTMEGTSADFTWTPGEPGRLLYLGRLDAKKGLDWLVDAWTAVFPDPGSHRLEIAGPCGMGFEAQWLALRARTSGRPDIQWHGAVDGPAKRNLLKRCSTLVLPSRSENFGNVVVEAMMMGRPVIATDATPWQELPKRGIGWRVPATAEGVRSGIHAWSEIEPAVLDTMGQSAQRYADATFSADGIARAWADIYAGILQSDGAPSAASADT